jgi:hypothetical protein
MADLFRRYIGRKRGRLEGTEKGRVKNDVKKELEGVRIPPCTGSNAHTNDTLPHHS